MRSAFGQKLNDSVALYWRNLANIIEKADFSDREAAKDDFAGVVDFMLRRVPAISINMMDDLGLMSGTAGRWAARQFSPHPLIRKTVQHYMVRELRERADALEWGVDDYLAALEPSTEAA